MSDAWRLAMGTLTRVPVTPPRSIRAPVAGRAMLLAPLVGVALAALPAAVLLGVAALDASPLLGALLALGLLAWLTRGLHLDGLADVADGLGSGAPPARAREIMKDSATGAFGVVALVITLGLQAVALGSLTDARTAAFALLVATVTGRVAIVWACVRAIAAASRRGLGAAVAGSVAPLAATTVTLLVLGAVAAAAWALGLEPAAGWPATSVLGLLAAGVLLRWCMRRVGGVTGDVLGAAVEVATTATLVAVALATGALG